MKLRSLNADKYYMYCYFDPNDPLGPAKIRDDAPDWAKKMYEEDIKRINECHEKGYI